MKTTIDLPDDLLERSKVVARQENSTLKALIEEGLRLALAAGAREWAIPWPCAHEFFAIVTHPRIFKTARRPRRRSRWRWRPRSKAPRFTMRALQRSAFRTAWPNCGRQTATSPGFRR